MKPMTPKQQDDHAADTLLVRSVLSALRLSKLSETSEDIQVAMERLDNWLTENDGRWVA
jgi:hypothetical protein